MDIYLSVNNREEVMTLPVIPPSFTVSKPQQTEKFETVSAGELMLIGKPKLKKISFESFFPVRDYPYLRSRDLWGWDYVYKIDTWIKKKLPIRLIITDTPINMAVAVADFEYTIKTDGDLWYKLSLEEFNLLEEEVSASEEETDMEELNALKGEIVYLQAVVNELANPMVYNYIDENMPEWAKSGVQKIIDRKILNGDGAGLALTYGDLKTITWLERLGLLD